MPYPQNLDAFTAKIDRQSVIMAADINNLQNSIQALEKFSAGGYNPVTYAGADSTGAVDSTTAINNTISAAGSGTVVFPAGTYLVSGAGVSSGTATLIGMGSVVIQSTTGTALTVTGNCKLRNISFVAPTSNNNFAYGISNASFNVDALDCRFTGYANRAGDTGASTYAECVFTSGINTTPASSIGSLCLSPNNIYTVCTFTGTNGAQVQGGLFSRCAFTGNGDGVTQGQGWGVHMPQTTNGTPNFSHCYMRGLGTPGAYGIGMALGANAMFRFCDVEGTMWGLYYHDNAFFTAEFSSFRGTRTSGNCYGLNANKAGTGGAPLTGASFAYYCEFRASGPNNFDVAIPTNGNNGTLTTYGCHWSRLAADDGGDLTGASAFLQNREIFYKAPINLTNNSTTPTISSAGVFYVFQYTASTTITNILGGVAGQQVTFRCGNANTITFSTGAAGTGSIGTTKQASIGPNGTAVFVYDGSTWYGVV